MDPNTDSTGQSLTELAVAWTPDAQTLKRSRLLRFCRECGFDDDLDRFLEWSATDTAGFWDAAVRDLKLEFLEPYSRVMDEGEGLPWRRWFTGGRYNYVHNALDKRVGKPGSDRVCLIWEGDDGEVRRLTWDDLGELTSRVAAGFEALGIQPGDRVGIFMPMAPETVAVTFALGRLGAIYIPIFSGYGAEAVAQRLNDAEARFLVTADGFPRRGSMVRVKETADAALELAPTVERCVVWPRLGRSTPMAAGRDIHWSEFLGPEGSPPRTRATDPEDPCLIIYTSGTTGRPKGAVHPHCGFPIKGTQDMAHLFDVDETDTLFWFTDLGWMMGPWAIIGSLTLGATCVLFEGAPDYPHPGRVWELVERHRVTVLGIAPTAIRALMAFGADVPARFDLSSLRIQGSTGEPWNVEPWLWFLKHIGRERCPVLNYSGGTEVSGGILGCVSCRPLKPCCFNAVVPGMAVDVLDTEGRPVVGEVGELVIKNAWPGMTRGFWRDRERYEQTYWSRWPDVWVHGDWALKDGEGYWYILGRSDDTLKVAGKRIGPAEVESAAGAHPAVKESAAVGAPDPLKGEHILVFVVPNPGAVESDPLRSEIQDSVARSLGKPLRPHAVYFVDELPKTRNAKVLRRLVRAAHRGEPPGDLSSLERPEALDAIRNAR